MHKDSVFRIVLAALCLISLADCGGTKLLKAPNPISLEQPLLSVSDAQLNAHLDGVIVRDGPGTWARNADWDEYLVRVENVTDTPVTIKNVSVYDSTLTRQQTEESRRALVAASRETTRRYDDIDLEVKAGMSGEALFAAGAVGGATAVGAGAAALYMSSAAAVGVIGALVAAPVLVAGGITKSVNQSRVDDENQRRHTGLPVTLQAGEVRGLDLFFPLSPSPRRIEILYRATRDELEHILELDTSALLNGLHIVTE
ncbi:MAG: hypothetical protein R3F41_05045 [Gammaproteobacteria bacterium]|nr:hypothetical protein [Pseudomonadales bacterium]MCP5345331.1 hypothetical protein [Pseudomonadales bacterium]